MKKLVNNLKNKVWEKIIFIGTIPYIYTLGNSIYKVLVGNIDSCLTGCKDIQDKFVFMDWFLTFVLTYWPVFVIGAGLIIIGIVMLERKINKERININ